MSYTIPKYEVIDYPAAALREFHVYGYEWIDNLHFARPPGEFLPLPEEQLERYLTIARERFKAAGWHGDGEIGLMWLAPVRFSARPAHPPKRRSCMARQTGGGWGVVAFVADRVTV